MSEEAKKAPTLIAYAVTENSGKSHFTIIKHNGESIYFKIDYYDNELQGGSGDPDPQQTTRVMTIMLSHEY